MSEVHLDIAEAIGTITIDNPPLNLLSNGVREKLLQRLQEATAADQVRTVVVTGAGGRAFSAGSDVREFVDEIRERRGAERAERELRFLERIPRCPKPILAAIEGYALGGGCELAMACDFRVAGEGAQLGFPEIRLGVFPLNSVERSLLVVGEAWTKKLMFFGEPLDATTAHRAGLVHQIVPKGRALAVAHEWAGELAKLPGLTLRELKRLINWRYLELLAESAGPARDAAARVFESEDLQEGVVAFREKRAPRFRHR